MNRIVIVWTGASLGVRLGIAFGSITILLSAILGRISGNLAEEQIKQDIGQDLTQIAQQMSGSLDQNLFERYREIQIIAELEPFRNPQTSDSEIQAVLDTLQDTYSNYAWIGFADRQGVVQASTQGILEGASVAQRDWFVQAQDQPYVGDVHEAVLLAKLLPNPTGTPLRFVDVASPVRDAQGNFQGVLGAHLSWVWVEEVKTMLLATPAADGKDILVVDQFGTVLLGPEQWQGQMLELESLRLAEVEGAGYTVERWPDGNTYLVGFVESQGYLTYPGLGWTVLVYEPAAIAFTPARTLYGQILVGGLILGSSFAVIGWLTASLITKPLEKIAIAADQIRAGNRQAKLPKTRGRSEITRLSQALNQLLANLFRQEQELKIANANLEAQLEAQRLTKRSLQRDRKQLRQIVDGIEDPLLLREVGTGKMIFCNAGYRKLYGWTERSDTTPETWLQYVHPDDRHWVAQKINSETQGISFINDEYRTVDADGNIRWIWDRSFPIQDETGAVYRYVVIKRDITELKRSHEMLQSLMGGTAAVTGRAFFEKLVQYLAAALDADHVFVAERSGAEQSATEQSDPKQSGERLQTIAFWSQGQLRPNFTYHPANTPCAVVLREGRYCCISQVSQVFADHLYLPQIEAESYAGVALTNAAGDVLGTLSAISRKPLCDRTDYLTILQIFANRATAELERRYSQTALQESEARFRLLAENVKDLVCLHDLSGKFLYLSPSCQALLGFESDELVGNHPYRYCHPDDRALVRLQLKHSANGDSSDPIVYRCRRKDGSYIWLETLVKVIPADTAETDAPAYIQTSSRNITDKILVQQQLEHGATHDHLTGLPNRALLLERLDLAIERAKRHPHFCFAVLFVDLDRFKIINDSLGHSTGDQLLQIVAQKLERMTRDIDLPARIGGDEFVVLLEEIDSLKDAVYLAEQIVAEFRAPIWLAQQNIVVSTSVGIVLGTADHTDGLELLRNADIAMYSAKNQGGSRYAIFQQEMYGKTLQRLELENELRQALTRQEFTLRYQPIVALSTGKLAGFESLVRWQHPQKGFISPVDFIPIAEDTGLIVPLGLWILRESCRQMAQWQAQFPAAADLKISVNLSMKQLKEADLVAQVEQILQETGLAGRCLALEITESMFMEDIQTINERLKTLSNLAIQISIDDFGTGFSSLSYLHSLSVDNLKIDRSFVSNLFKSQRNFNIAKTIVKLSRQLGLKAIAEGIETPEQLQQLKAFGCDMGQGYLFNAPVTCEVAETLIAEISDTADGDLLATKQRE